MKASKVFDEVDYTIIKELHADARISFGKLAKKLGINERTVRRRIENLEETGAIRFATVCNPVMFGYANFLDVNITIEENRYDSVLEKLNEHPSICYISKGWGQNGITIQCRFKSSNDVNDFLYSYLEAIPGVNVESYYFEAQILRDADSWLPTNGDFAKSTRIIMEKENL